MNACTCASVLLQFHASKPLVLACVEIARHGGVWQVSPAPEDLSDHVFHTLQHHGMSLVDRLSVAAMNIVRFDGGHADSAVVFSLLQQE